MSAVLLTAAHSAHGYASIVLGISSGSLVPNPSRIERADVSLGWHVGISPTRNFYEVASDAPLQVHG